MRIGELASLTGTTTKTLRFYEDKGLLPPAERTASGYRDYGQEAISRLDFIRRGRAAGLTLAEIREVLDIRDAGTAPCRHVAELLDDRLVALDQQIADLEHSAPTSHTCEMTPHMPTPRSVNPRMFAAICEPFAAHESAAVWNLSQPL